MAVMHGSCTAVFVVPNFVLPELEVSSCNVAGELDLLVQVQVAEGLLLGARLVFSVVQSFLRPCVSGDIFHRF